ncbi:MAG: TlpA family protein disulfide reductase [Rickettsiaceae bacterium]|nr:MAG: TlpA family protein disulfide reductase [Rickettsiaceae bacterium]
MIKKKVTQDYRPKNTYMNHIFVCLIVLVMYFCYVPSVLAAKIVNLEKQDTPSDVPFFDENGNKHFLDQSEGKTLLIVFWATWCASCEKEMPDLDILAKDFRKLPFEVITLSQDFQGIEIVKKFFESKQIRYLRAYHDYHNQLFAAFSVVGLPSSFVISAEGKMVVSFNGIVNWYDNDIREILLSHIAGNPETPKNSYKIRNFRKPSNTSNSRAFQQQSYNSSKTKMEQNTTNQISDHKDEEKDLLNILQ